MVADAALGRAAAQVVLDAVAGEDLDRPVVHLHGEVNGELATWLAEDATHGVVEVEPLRGEVELLLGHGPRIDGRGDVLGGHESLVSLVGCRRRFVTRVALHERRRRRSGFGAQV